MAKLLTNVHVRDDEGTSHVFGPESDVPEWAQKKITNKSAWDGDAPEFDDEAADDEGPDDEPARSGRGSSLPVWEAYAKSLEIEVPDGASREDVIKLVDEKKAGKPAPEKTPDKD
jgi:hypothetical protein